MGSDRPTDLDDLMQSTLAGLRGSAPPDGAEEELIRLLAAWEGELRTALRALAGPPPDADRAAVDEEETPDAIRRRVDEYRGRCEGFVKALSLTLGHEAAARIEAEARRRA